MLLKRLLVVFSIVIILQGCGIGYRKAHKPDRFPPPDPTPRKLPVSRYGNPTSYEVFGETYHLLPTNVGYTERGVASWYGKKFHGRRASSGETYNMYAMTAAHKTLPIPVYAKVTNLENGRSIIVKINDRGPFVKNRLIDLSYAAATKLGVVKKGTAPVEVTTIIPGVSTIARTPPTPSREPKQTGNIEIKSVAAKPKFVAIPVTKTATTALATTTLPEKTSAATSSHSKGTTIACTEHCRNTPGDLKNKPKLRPEQNNTQSAQNIRYFLQIGAFGDKNNAIRLIDSVKAHLNEGFAIESVDNGSGQIHKVKVGPIETIEKADLLTEELEGFELGTPRLIIAN